MTATAFRSGSTLFWLICCGAVVAAIVLLTQLRGKTETQLHTAARKALLQQEYRSAQQFAQDLLQLAPSHVDGLMIAAVSASELQQFEDAVDYCRRVPQDAGTKFIEAQCLAGQLSWNQLGQFADAERFFRRAADADPQIAMPLQQLALLLSLQTRSWELIPIQLKLIQLQSFQPETILSLVQGDLLFPAADRLESLDQQSPNAAEIELAKSRILLLQKDDATAEEKLREAVSKAPDLAEARVRLGEVLLRRNQASDLFVWQQRLPDNALQHPKAWLVLGQIAEQQGAHHVAVRCFWEAGSRDAASISANYMLGRSLSVVGSADQGREFLERAARLESYRKLFDMGEGTPVAWSADLFRNAQQQAQQLGLTFEEYGFAKLALTLDPSLEWATAVTRRCESLLKDLPLQRTDPDADPFRSLDVSRFPLPELPLQIAATGEPSTRPASDSGAIMFQRVDSELGLLFEFDLGVDPSIRGAQRVYDFTGGGIAAIDFDLDKWVDLYLPQGCRLNPTDGSAFGGKPDQLWRNARGQRFQQIASAGLPEQPDYSQGVSSGDYDNDGFPDLYIANLGSNRLLRNNGDGTFSETTQQIAGDLQLWTTSCLICDLTGDSIPDLYAVNYLSGDILSRVCRDKTGRKASCAPQDFSGSTDQLFVGDGLGGFSAVDVSSGIPRADGKGLGIVAADLDHNGTLEVFVANDGVPNFLFLRSSVLQPHRFQEVAMERGMGVNGQGLSEACMGIIAEDLSGDGSLEIFVTNFLDETNTVYANAGIPGFFQDRTAVTDLGAPSVSVLGFGTQAVDADLDGLADVIVANGHVDDFSDRGVAFQMQPQFFRNRGAMKFELLAAGDFFKESYLGRAVARLDWNRDGAEEVAVSLIGEPYAVLKNVTTDRGGFLQLWLHDRVAARDATGTRVTLTRRDGVQVHRQLTAGDGYQSSNARNLVFGLGHDCQTVSLQIIWPNGDLQSFTDVAGNQQVSVVQGVDRLFSIPH